MTKDLIKHLNTINMKINIDSLFPVFLFGLLTLVSSCGSSVETERKIQAIDTNNTLKLATYNYNGPSTYTYEGCEYIVVVNGSATWGSHKGNCKNPIHKK